MAQRNLDTSWCYGKRLVEISGSFAPLTGSSGTVVASGVKGLGFGYAPNPSTGVMQAKANSSTSPMTTTPGITHTSGGLYTVTFEDPYADCIYQSADFAAANTSGTALWAQPVNNVSNLATTNQAPAITILIVNSSGSPTDAASTSQRVYFHAQFRDSTTQYAKP